MFACNPTMHSGKGKVGPIHASQSLRLPGARHNGDSASRHLMSCPWRPRHRGCHVPGACGPVFGSPLPLGYAFVHAQEVLLTHKRAFLGRPLGHATGAPATGTSMPKTRPFAGNRANLLRQPGHSCFHGNTYQGDSGQVGSPVRLLCPWPARKPGGHASWHPAEQTLSCERPALR